jgi:threonine synthase
MSSPIRYYSTNQKSPKVSFGEALLKGLAPDGGLYMPDRIPTFSSEEIGLFSSMEYHQIAFAVFRKFFEGEISDVDLQTMTQKAYNFEVPLEHVYDRSYVMRLDQGPTASFKDFAGRMMGQLMQHFLKKENRNLLILTATSGDTGSAMANAFYGLDTVKMVILFPETEVTDRQRKQMTTLHNNISVIALKATFDDCQALVKQAFTDNDLDSLQLSSSNSINIGRLLPQIVYYFYSFAKLRNKALDDDIIFSVPSGNFGDLMGGVIAMKMGLSVKKFVVAVNQNDEFPKLLFSKQYAKIEPSYNCLSSAMNVGHPSNLARLIEMFGGNMNEKGVMTLQPDYGALEKCFYARSISDSETKQTIKEAYEKFKLVLEPHGSVGWTCLNDYLSKNTVSKDQLMVTLETAHPAKFPDSIQQLLGFDPELPESLKGLEGKEEIFDVMENDYSVFKTYLKTNF